MSAVSVDPRALDALFAPFDRTDAPGLAVGVAHEGRPLYRRGFGLASVELPMALTPGVRLRIGSTTKHFACLCVMLLAEDGRLSADDSVRRHLPDLPDWAEPITLTQLMSHTGGARCSLDLLDTFSSIMTRPLSAAAQFAVMEGLASVNFAPGTDWMYCNGGYVLLNAVIARAAGRPFAEMVEERVLRPAGLFDTVVRPVDTDLRPNSATLHLSRPDGGYERGVFGPEISGEGAIVSTVDDMLRWLAHMRDPVVGTSETWRAIRTPVRLRDGRGTGYGYGLFVGGYRGAATVHHGGRVVGGACQMLTLPDHAFDVVILANRGDIDLPTLARAVVDACVAGLEPAAEAAPGPFPTGSFVSPTTARYVRLVAPDGAPALAEGSAFMPLIRAPDGSGAFWSRFGTLSTIAPEGEGLRWSELGAEDRLEPLAAPARDETPEILGRYACDEARLEAEVAAGAPAQITVTGPYGGATFGLEQASAGLWLARAAPDDPPMVLERDGSDLLFTSARVRRLRLVRK